MTYQHQYFELTWNAHVTGSGTTKHFRMAVEASHPHDLQQLSSFQRGLTGRLLEVQAPISPRMVDGIIIIRGGDGNDWGTLAELKDAWASPNLTCKMYDGETAWPARFMGNWTPVNMDPMGVYHHIAIHLEEK